LARDTGARGLGQALEFIEWRLPAVVVAGQERSHEDGTLLPDR